MHRGPLKPVIQSKFALIPAVGRGQKASRKWLQAALRCWHGRERSCSGRCVSLRVPYHQVRPVAGPPVLGRRPAPRHGASRRERFRRYYHPDQQKGRGRRRFERLPVRHHGCPDQYREWTLRLSSLLDWLVVPCHCPTPPTRPSFANRRDAAPRGALSRSLSPHRDLVPYHPAQRYLPGSSMGMGGPRGVYYRPGGKNARLAALLVSPFSRRANSVHHRRLQRLASDDEKERYPLGVGLLRPPRPAIRLGAVSAIKFGPQRPAGAHPVGGLIPL